MKIGIVGNYGHDNNGDEAILQGILQQLTEHLHINKQDITIFSNNPENTYERYGVKSAFLIKKKGNIASTMLSTLSQHAKIIKGLDVLIIGGGGILMDMYKRDAPLYSIIAFIGRLFRCRIIIYGVGAGPITTGLGKVLIKGMANSASMVAVRDEKSKKLLESIGIKKEIEIIADPAFTLGDEKPAVLSKNIKKIGVTAVPYYSSEYWPESNPEKYQSYITGMAENLDALIERLDAEVIFYSTKFPQDVKVTEEICHLMQHSSNVKVEKGNLHPTDLMKLSSEMDLIIGTRLHSLILAVAAGTPIIGIGYHKKVQSFMERLDKEDLYVDISKLHQRPIVDVVEHLSEHWMDRQEEFGELSGKMKSEALYGAELMKKLIR
ncbi:polysaccharide pyruvyl transferase family protein [Falsibacillus pallidus]|uniref:polysaccharide pyruvyl transferase family protein n=1 Tax=Falsibacillus pallidus TaxID=493781 RepID=UPI003D9A0910